MKIIHTGDLHIGSAMRGLSKDKARLRREELLDAFRRLTEYAKANGVTAVLIAGDLFDENDVSPQTVREVLSVFASAKPVCFFYVSGNHDGAFDCGELPDNVYTFSQNRGWKSYALGENITVTGADEKYFDNAFSALPNFSADAFNIVLLHGAETIPFPLLKNRNIDYLALGHIHKPMLTSEWLDGRCKWRYCGCLAGRGFDEVGKRGCFLLEIDKGVLQKEEFLSFSKREIVEIRVDISTAKSYSDVEKTALTALKNTPEEYIVKLTLCGRHTADLRKETELLSARLSERFFFVKIVDESRPQIDFTAFENDRTERGEFIKEVGRYEMNEDFRAEVLEVGLKALVGEEIDL